MNKEKKYQKLALSLLFDAIGYVSYLIPGLGELSDIVWAPASAYIMTKMYKGNKGKVAGAIAFIEEAMPGLDVVPTFTLMWLYTYVFSSKETKTTIEV
ncbi:MULTISPECIES: hypothetical protein [Tenacibaculum]|uniref:Uncharacterized protein n=1 Tax=Tenacibaculum mesophilum TaxID=104268 RepID=A0AAE9MMG9_9FLAO|nr:MULTISPECIES: hypothetical protein [Tenacibaculum]GFD76142.1 hypothetical protein KUL113_55620 [Tenacibaculum sp. KUL113]GFD83661.1 hypothetical protein KUL118_65230 [Tenacibaculum sp. KUL118]AZJ31834.1 hypothetical protein D6200_04325 [Tenacibaculum mesophilum]KAF9657942.1 hypothetical protein HBA12_12030 [Tenacibaculum mesophilum]MCG7502177.1 hypothetical protein [Tenacibaculum sp. Mcav3-52]